MSHFKLLIVEDDQREIDENYIPTIKRIKREKEIEINYELATNLDGALAKLDSSYDGAIVDLRLDASGEEKGNDGIRKIHSSYKIPIAVLTGTHQDVEGELSAFVRVITRDYGMDLAIL